MEKGPRPPFPRATGRTAAPIQRESLVISWFGLVGVVFLPNDRSPCGSHGESLRVMRVRQPLVERSNRLYMDSPTRYKRQASCRKSYRRSAVWEEPDGP